MQSFRDSNGIGAELRPGDGPHSSCPDLFRASTETDEKRTAAPWMAGPEP